MSIFLFYSYIDRDRYTSNFKIFKGRKRAVNKKELNYIIEMRIKNNNTVKLFI